MPKRTDIKKVMVIGSGPIVIGQAAEFDTCHLRFPNRQKILPCPFRAPFIHRHILQGTPENGRGRHELQVLRHKCQLALYPGQLQYDRCQCLFRNGQWCGRCGYRQFEDWGPMGDSHRKCPLASPQERPQGNDSGLCERLFYGRGPHADGKCGTRR